MNAWLYSIRIQQPVAHVFFKRLLVIFSNLGSFRLLSDGLGYGTGLLSAVSRSPVPEPSRTLVNTAGIIPQRHLDQRNESQMDGPLFDCDVVSRRSAILGPMFGESDNLDGKLTTGYAHSRRVD